MTGRGAVVAYLREGNDFLIATHVSPDGDALGSSIALALGLGAVGKRAYVYDKDGVPASLSFLPKKEIVRSGWEGLDTRSMDLVLADCNGPQRAEVEGVPFRRACVIDHHETETEFEGVKWIDPEEPATGLMVYRILSDLGVSITPEIATNLYTAIAIDTGTFRYPSTTAETLRVSADLIEHGADPASVAEHIYNTWDRARFTLWQRAMAAIEVRGETCFMTMTESMFRETGTTHADTENFVNFPLMIEGASVSAALRETSHDTWRVSIRSKKDGPDVAVVAEKWAGGGHRNAAGCTMTGTAEQVKTALVGAISRPR